MKHTKFNDGLTNTDNKIISGKTIKRGLNDTTTKNIIIPKPAVVKPSSNKK